MRYEYVCDSCNLVYEKEHSMKDSPKYTCTHCQTKLRKNITGGV